MALPVITIAGDNLLRVAFLGAANGSAIVCVQYYTPYFNTSFVPNVVNIEQVCAEAADLWKTMVMPGLVDTYEFKLCSCTIYKSPYAVAKPIPLVGFKMNPFATADVVQTGNGGVATDSLPDYNVFRVYKKTGRAGRSFRGFMNFSPIAEAATTGQTFTAGFLGGLGLQMKNFVGTELWKADAPKTMYPVLFRITEYLNHGQPLVVPSSNPWSYQFEATISNNRVGILRSRKMRAPSA